MTSIPAPAPGRDRLPSLTGLRFWAALLVVLYHLSRQVGAVPGLSEAVWYGRSGVTFFFVLSGAVLAWTYDGAGVPARVFLWRRFARIWPLLAVSVVGSVAVWGVMGRAVSLKAVGATLLLVHAWFPEPVVFTGGNPAAWSLSDEAWFYVTFPVLLAVLAGRRARVWGWTAAGVSVAALLLWPALSGLSPTDRTWALDYLPLTRSLQFVLGVVAGLALKRGWRPPVSLPVALGLVVAWHLVLIPWSNAVPDALWYSPYSASQLLSAPLFAALICAAARADLDGRRTGLGGAWMIRLGHWSFAWYLLHEIVIRAAVFHWGKPAPGGETLVFWAGVSAASLGLAALAYHCVERPAERWLRGRVGRRPATTPPSAHQPA
ncbi:Peptidoglycan/LPS O-acetylase OafA/YrhL, contains acyltransferase and SGNH-hydrolase domains [Streptomyces sp. yr375]|uniref:acyltransferase family protein n=1 Tax=Streptomyces sp. yr375 TaxID=1761906 RepID=UPI0008BFF39B|nr:acyltransferase [Streptomyces sp. yr375]SES48587.1 Peptidoglycan/LPS O-acetylase OafA/YrhL, contains acyltransferase and SGNH-hydrolase domains [Streptomyces sp. yr375]